LVLFGHIAMLELSPKCEPKRTFPDHCDLGVHARGSSTGSRMRSGGIGSARCFAFRNSRMTTRRANHFHIFHLQTVEPSCEKYTAWSFASISFINGVVPARMRGVSRSSRTSVSECGGRGSVGRESGDDRADLDGLVSQPARRRTALIAYGKAVWSWHPLLVSSSRR
jgi:hypothetical protein